MIQISKDEYLFIKQRTPDVFVTICSKRKHGTKGNRASGKTYYCPENRRYTEMINMLRREDKYD